MDKRYAMIVVVISFTLGYLLGMYRGSPFSTDARRRITRPEFLGSTITLNDQQYIDLRSLTVEELRALRTGLLLDQVILHVDAPDRDRLLDFRIRRLACVQSEMDVRP